MKGKHADFDHFIHAFSSPLTALHGATALLRRRLGTSQDLLLPELIMTLERSIARLRIASDLILAQASIHNDELLIRLPSKAFYALGAGERSPDRASQSGDGDAGNLISHFAGRVPPLPDDEPVLPIVPSSSSSGGTVLLISDVHPYVTELDQTLKQGGITTILSSQAAEGVDVARQLTPDLIILDIDMTSQGELLFQVISDDPDTKMIPLLLLCKQPESNLPPLFPPSRAATRELPVEQVTAIAREMLTAGREPITQHPRILVVDDDTDIRRLVALQLEDEGCRTTTVSSGAEALQIAQRQPFDLIILDLMLPDLDGFAVLGGLRAQPQTALTPIILLSALNAPHEKVRGLQLGADDYVTKPFSAAELSARVQAAMRRSELEGGANPSTRLPGNVTIERAIMRRINQKTPFAVCYSDLDNFKAYNDTYSFLKGDAIIQQTAHVLMAAVRQHGNPDDFVGHIGGDDFVIITTPDRVEALCCEAIARFDEVIPFYYDAEVRARGYIDGIDRQGNPARFPLVSISIAVVTNRERPFSHPGEVAQRSIEPKKLAKRQLGSVYVVDD